MQYNYFQIYTEQGQLIGKNLKFRRLPYITLNIFKNLQKKKKNPLRLFNLSVKICFLKKLTNIIYLYNGKRLNIFKPNSLFLFKIFGEFITTRVVKSGKILHVTKKNKIKKKN